MIVAGVLAPPAICHDQPFDNPTATDPHNLDVYDITGTASVNGGVPIAYIVQDSCFEQNATTTADVILWPKTPLRTDDVVSRFTCGPGGITSWFSSLFVRSTGTAQTDYVYANFRGGQCYLGRRISSSSSDWTSNTGAPSMTDAGSVVELAAIGTSYWVVYETAAGVRTTVCTYNDSSGTYARGLGRRRVAARIGYSGSRTPTAIPHPTSPRLIRPRPKRPRPNPISPNPNRNCRTQPHHTRPEPTPPELPMSYRTGPQRPRLTQTEHTGTDQNKPHRNKPRP